MVVRNDDLADFLSDQYCRRRLVVDPFLRDDKIQGAESQPAQRPGLITGGDRGRSMPSRLRLYNPIVTGDDDETVHPGCEKHDRRYVMA